MSFATAHVIRCCIKCAVAVNVWIHILLLLLNQALCCACAYTVLPLLQACCGMHTHTAFAAEPGTLLRLCVYYFPAASGVLWHVMYGHVPCIHTLLLLLHQALQCACRYTFFRVGQNRIYTPYMTVHLVISLPKIPYVHRIHMVLANPTILRFAAAPGVLATTSGLAAGQLCAVSCALELPGRCGTRLSYRLRHTLSLSHYRRMLHCLGALCCQLCAWAPRQVQRQAF